MTSHRAAWESPACDTLAGGLVPAEYHSALPPLPETPRFPSQPPSRHTVASSYSKSQSLYNLREAGSTHDTTESRTPAKAEPTSIKRSSSTYSLSGTYPILTTRQGGMNTPRAAIVPKRLFTPVSSPPVSPVKRVTSTTRKDSPPSINPALIPLPETPAVNSRKVSSPTKVGSTQSTRSVSTSFHMLSAGDLSLLGDCRPPSAAGDSEDSFDFAVEEIRPLTGRKARISILPDELRTRQDVDATPSRRTQSTVDLLKQSTILPNSPSKHAHLLASTNALSRVAPPWEEISSEIPFESTSTVTSVPKARSAVPRSAAKTKRTFPASSSGQSLSSVGEEGEGAAKEEINAGDVSTLLPTTPARTRHLLDPEHMLKHEDISLLDGFDGPSLFFPSRPPRALSTLAEGGSSMRPPVPDSMRKPPRAERRTQMGHRADADVTMDVRDLMARMTKPKRASGTEESFIDLLHGEHEVAEHDELVDADEPFLPRDLRPGRHLTMDPTIHRSRSARNLVSSAQVESLPPSSVRKARRRSKSLSETMQAIPSAQEVPLTKRRSPEKAARSIATPRARQSMLPPAATSRRVSLSTGALPLPTSASHKKMDLPNVTRAPHARASIAPRPGVSTSAAAAVSKRSLPPPASATLASSAMPRSRHGSTTSTVAAASRGASSVSTSASHAPVAPTTRSGLGVRTTFKPTTSAARSTHSETTARPTSLAARTAGLPKPGGFASARSAPLPSAAPSSRGFGADAGGVSNRLARPSAAATSTRPSTFAKPSTDPVSITSLNSRKTSTVQPRPKSMSTPASTTVQPSATAAISARLREVQKGSIPPSRTGGLPRPTSRLPAPSTSRVGSVARGGSTSAVDLLSMKARIEKLQARTAAGAAQR